MVKGKRPTNKRRDAGVDVGRTEQEQTLAAARTDREARRPELSAETRRLQHDRRRLGDERDGLVTAILRRGLVSK